MAMHVKKGDHVRVIAGKDKGVTGDIIAVNPEKQTVTVAGVNVVKRHRKDTQGGTNRQIIKGGILSSEAPIHVSNVALVVRQGAKEVTTRVGYEAVEETRKRPDGSQYTVIRHKRISRKTGKEI